MAKPRALSVAAIQQAQVSSILQNLRGTVGVAPGSYTLQLGAPVMPAPAPNSWQMNLPVAPCPPDGWGTGAYGVPRVGWYDIPVIPLTAGGQPASPSSMAQQVAYDPYGTQSQLKGTFDVVLWLYTNRTWVGLGIIGLFGLAIVGVLHRHR